MSELNGYNNYAPNAFKEIKHVSIEKVILRYNKDKIRKICSLSKIGKIYKAKNNCPLKALLTVKAAKSEDNFF